MIVGIFWDSLLKDRHVVRVCSPYPGSTDPRADCRDPSESSQYQSCMAKINWIQPTLDLPEFAIYSHLPCICLLNIFSLSTLKVEFFFNLLVCIELFLPKRQRGRQRERVRLLIDWSTPQMLAEPRLGQVKVRSKELNLRVGQDPPSAAA